MTSSVTYKSTYYTPKRELDKEVLTVLSNTIQYQGKIWVSMSEANLCAFLYDLHTTTLMLQTEEERFGKILDADYSKVDIDKMVDDLDVAKATKGKLK